LFNCKQTFQKLIEAPAGSSESRFCLQERISRFKRKVSKVNSEALLKKSKRATEVNIQAANRFITAAIPELSKEQKQALKQVHTVTLCMQVCSNSATHKLQQNDHSSGLLHSGWSKAKGRASRAC